MRIALTLGFTLVLAQAVSAMAAGNMGESLPVPATAEANPSAGSPNSTGLDVASAVAPRVLSPDDVALYRQIFSAERKGEISKANKLLETVSDPTLEGYAAAAHLLGAGHAAIGEIKDWLSRHRDLAIADRIYRLAVRHATKTVRRNHKLIRVAVVTDIPAPIEVASRTGGYEDEEPPQPVPSGTAGRAVFHRILTDIKAGKPDRALEVYKRVSDLTPEDAAILAHRIAASYLAEGMDAEAFGLATSIANTDPVPALEWDAGFSAYRLGQWAEAAQHLEKLARNRRVTGPMRARAAFWAARAHMQAGEPKPVVSLLMTAAKEQPSFYGPVAERMLGMDSATGFTDPVLTKNDFDALMAVPAAHRAVALWQIGQTDSVGPELNRAFVNNNVSLDPAMAALARDLGVTNIELRASEASVAQGLLLTGLFPVPPYQPKGGYKIDNALVLAIARIESRFQNGSTSSAGAHGIMQIMPRTARLLAGRHAAAHLNDPEYSLSLGQRYISELLDHLNGNLLELGGAYNAGPGAASRWLQTKAGKDDPLLFVESIPIAETRSYVRRLMEYQWMYRRRFGQEARSLDETARGQWPIYHPAIPPAPVASEAPSGSGDATAF
jgi:soluble lytic murein transglycosylase